MNPRPAVLPAPSVVVDPFAPSHELTVGIACPSHYRSGAPHTYVDESGWSHLLVGVVRGDDTQRPVPSLIELWHEVQLDAKTGVGFSRPLETRRGKNPWQADWRGRMARKATGGFAFAISHPSWDHATTDVIRPLYLRVSSPGYEPVVVEAFPEPWKDITSVEVTLKRELETAT